MAGGTGVLTAARLCRWFRNNQRFQPQSTRLSTFDIQRHVVFANFRSSVTSSSMCFHIVLWWKRERCYHSLRLVVLVILLIAPMTVCLENRSLIRFLHVTFTSTKNFTRSSSALIMFFLIGFN